jgi:hypothetical protein
VNARVALVIFFMWPRHALAEEPLDLAWDAPAGCPPAAEVRADVARIVGATPGQRVPVQANVTVTRSDDVWTVTLSAQTLTGSLARTFTAESCSAAADATAVILAMAVNDQTGPSVLPKPIPAPFVAAGASLTATSGPLPSPAVGGEIAVALLARRLRMELAGAYSGSQTRSTLGAGAHFQLVVAAMRVAYAWRFERFELGPLLGAGLERMGASGFGGTSASFDQSAVWASILGGGIATYAIVPWFALRASLLGEIPLARPSFVVLEPDPAPATPIHRPAALGGAATLGAEARIF